MTAEAFSLEKGCAAHAPEFMLECWLVTVQGDAILPKKGVVITYYFLLVNSSTVYRYSKLLVSFK